MQINEFQRYISAVQGQYIRKDAVMKLLYTWAGGYDYVETTLRGAVEKIRKAEAVILEFREAEDAENDN